MKTEDRVTLTQALDFYKARREEQLIELRATEFVILHLKEQWRKEHPWEAEQDEVTAPSKTKGAS